MANIKAMVCLAFGLSALSPLGASAQDRGGGVEYGAGLFQTNCSACHGSTGRGDGAIADLFAQRPRDLSMIASENDGVFPFESILASIDGREMVRGHGSEMPVWGDFLSVEAQAMLLPNAQTANEVVQGRLLALTYFLQSIQQ